MQRDPATRVAIRYVQANYFTPGDVVLYGKYKNQKGIFRSFGSDKWGNPTVEIEPIPKGRKQNKIFGLFRIWRADVKEKALAEIAEQQKMAAKAEYLYAGVILDSPSQAALIRWWEQEVGPLLPSEKAHHMTIQVKPDPMEAQALPLGRRARLQVIGYAQSDTVQAVAVKASVGTVKAHPHVTVALGPGGESSHANALLAHGYERVRGPTLTGEIGVVTNKRRVIFDLKRLR